MNENEKHIADALAREQTELFSEVQCKFWSDQENKSLIQKNLYSTMVINERTVRIFHKDFLADPKVLLGEFGEK